MIVFLLQHSYDIGEFEETKIIGIFSSEEKAEKTKERCKTLPGFNKYSDEAFHIDKYEVDKVFWEDGFISWEEAMK